MLSDSDKKIAEILKEEGVIPQKDLEKFYKEELSMNKFLLEVLVEEKKIKEKEIIPLLSKKLGITYLEISDFFEERVKKANKFGIDDIILDVGIGFGKTLENNLNLIQNLEHFKKFNYPILIGASRKSMINEIIHTKIEDRLERT